MKFAYDNNMVEENATKKDLYNFYLSLDAEKDSIIKQAEVIKKIAQKESSVIVGRSADYILQNFSNLINIYIYAPLEYRVSKVQEMYKDTVNEARKHINKSDKSRAAYYEIITNNKWGDKENYDLCINSSIGNEKTADIICEYVKRRMELYNERNSNKLI